MKKIFLLLLLLPFVTFAAPDKQERDKSDKKAAEAKAFKAICELVNSKQFQIDIDKVYPLDGFDVTRFNPRGKIVVTDSTAKGFLPYFGRAHTLPYGEGGSIQFDEKIRKLEIEITEKRKKREITFNFSIPGNNDFYRIFIKAMSNGKCSIQLQSNNRNQCTYGGTISTIKEQE